MNMYKFPNRSAVLLALLVLLLHPVVSRAAEKGASEVKGTTGYSQERYKSPPPYTGPPRSGEQVYTDYCMTCHARTTQGAPLPDDDIEWGIRLKQGVDVLVEHVLKGYKELMPERGGCRNCSDGEVRAAVMYILHTSGVVSKGEEH